MSLYRMGAGTEVASPKNRSVSSRPNGPKSFSSTAAAGLAFGAFGLLWWMRERGDEESEEVRFRRAKPVHVIEKGMLNP
jgi:hypothetical protein